MSTASDPVVIDTAELRSASRALRHAADGTAELHARLPREAWGAPDWLATGALETLGAARGWLDELRADLAAEADWLDARAAEVDGAEQRWASIADGELRCGCVLPSGQVVVQADAAAATAASAAWGAGAETAFVGAGAVGLAAAGGTTDGVFVVGGTSLSPAFTIVQPPLESPSAAGVMTIGGQGLFSPGSAVQPALGSLASPAGIMIIGGGAPISSLSDAYLNAAADVMAARIGPLFTPGGQTPGFDVVGYTAGQDLLNVALANASFTPSIASGTLTIQDSSGQLSTVYAGDEAASGAYKPFGSDPRD